MVAEATVTGVEDLVVVEGMAVKVMAAVATAREVAVRAVAARAVVRVGEAQSGVELRGAKDRERSSSPSKGCQPPRPVASRSEAP